jgi:Bacterial regulatory helix-turn-helix protein, lysR family
MDVDTRLLRYFAVVAQEGNLTRAARRLFVSQPALTKQIKQLESQLGVQLFTRSRPGVTYRLVTGVSPSQVGVAWPPAADVSPVVQDFVRCCRDHRPTL